MSCDDKGSPLSGHMDGPLTGDDHVYGLSIYVCSLGHLDCSSVKHLQYRIGMPFYFPLHGVLSKVQSV